MSQDLDQRSVAGRPDAVMPAQTGRVALWSPVMLGLGITTYFAIPFEPPPEMGVAAILVAAALCVLPRLWQATRLPALAAAMVGLGIALAIGHSMLAGTPVLQRAIGPADITARVVDAFRHRDGRPRVLLEVHKVEGLAAERTPDRVRIALRKTDELPRPGVWVTARVRLSPLPSPVMPDAYDFARAAYFSGIGAYGFAVGPLTAIEPVTPASWAESGGAWIAVLRQEASLRIHAALPGSAGAIAAALTVGDRSDIDPADDQALRDSSLAHILSISGLHMAIVGLGVFGAIRLIGALIPPLALRFDLKKWAAGTALVASGVYLAISGASVPAQRSFIMIAMMFVAVLLDRAPFSLRVVAIAALVVLAIAPESVVDPSFQMSFAAVVALIAGFETFEAWQGRRGEPLILRDSWTGRIGYAVAVALLASLLAGFATAPYAAYHFNRVAAYGVIANLASAPLVSFVIMPFAALTVLALPLGLEGWPLIVVGWGLDAMLAIAHWVANLPGAAFVVPSWPGLSLGLVTLGGLWLALWRGRLRLYGLGLLAAAAVVGSIEPSADILIDRDAKNVAVRDADGRFAVVSGRRAAFAVEEWLQRDGDGRNVRESARAGREHVWVCAQKICEASVQGRRVGYLERAADARAACDKQFDLLIAAREISPCPTGLTISLTDTLREGAMAIRVTPDGFDVRSVRDGTGERPWTNWPD